MAAHELAANETGTFLRLPRVVSVSPMRGLTVWLVFSDGVAKELDLEPYLHGPLFERVRNDPEYFRTVHVDVDTIAWSDELAIAPETLYYDGNPPWPAAEHMARRPSKSNGQRRSGKSRTQVRSKRKT